MNTLFNYILIFLLCLGITCFISWLTATSEEYRLGWWWRFATAGLMVALWAVADYIQFDVWRAK